MQNSACMLFSCSLIVITVFLATITIQTVTNSNISAQQNNLNPLTTSFTSPYYSIPTAVAEDDEDDIAEHNRNADKKHD